MITLAILLSLPPLAFIVNEVRDAFKKPTNYDRQAKHREQEAKAI
jgi:hypothetical protein